MDTSTTHSGQAHFQCNGWVLDLISSAVFKENVEVLSWSWPRCRRRRHRHAKTLTSSNISVITEDIYLKLRLVVHYQKGNPYQKGR